MFGFLKRLFRRRKSVEALRAKWNSCKTPPVAEDLARALLDKENLDEALRVLKEAYRLFPRAERIRSYYHHTLRLKSSQEIRQLRQAIASDGRPEVYARLAELYRYLGRFEEALEVARGGTEKFPNFSGNYLAIGRIHYTRFLKTASARDGRQAAENLLKAYELDPQNFKTLFHLVKLFLTVGDSSQAEKYLETLSNLVPGDSRVTELWEKLKEVKEKQREGPVDCFSRYEAQKLGRKAVFPGGELRTREELEPVLDEIASLNGVLEVHVVNSNGELISSKRNPSDRPSFQPVVQGMLQTARVNSRRMSIGAFVNAVLSCSNVKIFLRDLEGNGMAVVGESGVREDLIQKKMAAFAERCFCEAGKV